jgi:hypothetical protein
MGKMQRCLCPIAVVIIIRPRDNAILVIQGHKPHKNQTFYRPLGGRIEFGEPSAQLDERR